ncbi:vacuolar protein sorting 16 [Brevipalpus obovatus]|uniref:vacuolar protein sorting 16 n=1 Tax=Brevipalpus obovatus TaxID=246614 RepID=UPI003D9F1EAC
MTLPTADWNPLGSEFYRRIELGQMNWIDYGIDLNKSKIHVAPKGGNIALQPIEENGRLGKFLDAPQDSNVKASSSIFIFSSLGDYISSLRLKCDHALAIGWSHREELIIIGDDAVVYIYNLFSEFQKSFLLPIEGDKSVISECRIFSNSSLTSIVILKDSSKFVIIQDIDSPTSRQYPEVHRSDMHLMCWTAFFSVSHEIQIILAKEANLFYLSPFKYEQMIIQRSIVSNILNIVLSDDNKNIALYLDTGILWMGSLEGSQATRINEFLTKSGEKPDSMVWCGNETVCSLWSIADILLLVGLEKEWMNYYMGGPVHLIPELDGVRVISRETNEIIQKVPDQLVQIFKIGSISAGALLLDACKEFEKRNHKAYEYMKLLGERDEIKLSVEQCTVAAGHEFQISTQKMLLRAASFGKLFVPDVDPELFSGVCHTLRLLNALRAKPTSMLMTYGQIESLSTEHLIDRIIRRRHYYLAIKVAKYLKVKEEEGIVRILRDWAFLKIKTRESSDGEVAQGIMKKIDSSSGVTFAELAEQAIKEERAELARLLLIQEYRPNKQVPLLLDLKQYDQALKKATESGNSDLIYMVIHCLSQERRKDFISTLKKYPDAYLLYKRRLEETDLEKLCEIHFQDGDFNSRGFTKFRTSLKNQQTPEEKRYLFEAQECFRKAKDDFAVSSLEDQLKLIENQEKLEKTCKQPFVGLSLQETMQRLLREGEEKLAEGLRKDFKVSERRYWWLKIDVLAEKREWHELEKFSKAKRSPIGYEPFVTTCLKYKNRIEAQKYVGRVREEYKISFYVKTGLLEEAAKFALTTRNIEALDYIAKKCTTADQQLAEKISNMKKQLLS